MLKVKAKNFLSWKEMEFSINEGVTLITGFDYDDGTSEGSGKSAIFNAICWGLYGKLPKEAKIDDVIRHGTKSCFVIVSLQNFSVVRKRKPNDLYIIDSSGNEVRGKDQKETQNLIEKELKFSFDTFCQTLYFPQNFPFKFLTSNQEAKSKILSEIQNLNVYDRARDLAKTKIKSLTNEIQTHTQNAERSKIHWVEAKNKIKLLEANIEERKVAKEERVKTLTQKKTKADSDLVEVQKTRQKLVATLKASEEPKEVDYSEVEPPLRDSLAETNLQLSKVEEFKREGLELETSLKGQIANQTRATAKLEKLNDKLEKLNLDLEAQKTHLVELEKEENPNCPTCNQAWHSSKKVLMQKEVQKYKRLEKDKAELRSSLNDEEENQHVATKVIENLEAKIAAREKLPDTSELKAQKAEIENKLTAISREQKLFREKKEAYVELQNQLRLSDNTLQHHLLQVETADQELELILSTPVNLTDLEEKIAEITIQQQQNEEKVRLSEAEIKSLNKELAKLETLKKAFRDVKGWVFTNALTTLNYKVATFLNELFEVPVTLEFSTDNFKIETSVIINGEDQPLGLCSGGQFRRLSLAVDLALSELTKERCGTSFPCLILDEPFKDLSENSMERVLNVLSLREEPTLLIEHNSILKSIVRNTLNVERRNGVSQFCL